MSFPLLSSLCVGKNMNRVSGAFVSGAEQTRGYPVSERSICAFLRRLLKAEQRWRRPLAHPLHAAPPAGLDPRRVLLEQPRACHTWGGHIPPGEEEAHGPGQPGTEPRLQRGGGEGQALRHPLLPVSGPSTQPPQLQLLRRLSSTPLLLLLPLLLPLPPPLRGRRGAAR